MGGRLCEKEEKKNKCRDQNYEELESDSEEDEKDERDWKKNFASCERRRHAS